MENVRILFFTFIFLIGNLLPMAHGNQIYDLKEGRDSLDARLLLLEDPNTKTIDFSTYEIVFDEAGKVFLAALIRAAERGVQIRGLVDRRIAKSNPMLIPYLLEKGIELKFYSPITIRFWDALLRPFQLFRRFNSRLHDKMFIANSEVIVLGDKNYGNKYYNKFNFLPKENFYMSGKEIVLKGDGVADYLEYFKGLWEQKEETTPVKNIPKYAGIALTDRWRAKFDQLFSPLKNWIQAHVPNIKSNSTLHGYENAEFIHSSEGKTTLMKIMEKIKNAEPGSKIMIENSYFVMFPELRTVLKTALANNVDITLNLNYTPDKWVIAQALAIDVKELIEMGINIYLNRDVPTHAKMILIEHPNGEKEVIITSANFDPRSYRINSESGISVRSATLFDYYQKEFEEVTKRQTVDVSKSNQCIRFYVGKNLLPKSTFIGRKAVKVLRPQL